MRISDKMFCNSSKQYCKALAWSVGASWMITLRVNGLGCCGQSRGNWSTREIRFSSCRITCSTILSFALWILSNSFPLRTPNPLASSCSCSQSAWCNSISVFRMSCRETSAFFWELTLVVRRVPRWVLLSTSCQLIGLCLLYIHRCAADHGD